MNLGQVHVPLTGLIVCNVLPRKKEGQIRECAMCNKRYVASVRCSTFRNIKIGDELST